MGSSKGRYGRGTNFWKKEIGKEEKGINRFEKRVRKKHRKMQETVGAKMQSALAKRWKKSTTLIARVQKA